MAEKFMYPEAGGPLASPAVKKEMAKFRRLPEHTRSALVPVFPFILGSSTGPYKPTPEELNYVDASPFPAERECRGCVHGMVTMMTGQPFCSAMECTIDPLGWCDRWAQIWDYPWDLVKKLNTGK